MGGSAFGAGTTFCSRSVVGVWATGCGSAGLATAVFASSATGAGGFAAAACEGAGDRGADSAGVVLIAAFAVGAAFLAAFTGVLFGIALALVAGSLDFVVVFVGDGDFSLVFLLSG